MRRIALALVLAVPILGAGAPPERHRGEFLQMWDAVVAGSQMGPGDGWFKPSQTRYTWPRLAAPFDKNKDGRISAEELGASQGVFAALDRDGSGAVTRDDLDWSDDSMYARQMSLALQLLRRGDRNGDRKLTKEEWGAVFEQAARGKDAVDAEAVRRLLFPPSAPQPPKGMSSGPPKEVLLIGLLTGELGSAAEGPKPEAVAPDFTLMSPDGKTRITLSDYRGKKPVVLIFGSFT
jgi:EF hand